MLIGILPANLWIFLFLLNQRCKGQDGEQVPTSTSRPPVKLSLDLAAAPDAVGPPTISPNASFAELTEEEVQREESWRFAHFLIQDLRTRLTQNNRTKDPFLTKEPESFSVCKCTADSGCFAQTKGYVPMRYAQMFNNLELHIFREVCITDGMCYQSTFKKKHTTYGYGCIDDDEMQIDFHHPLERGDPFCKNDTDIVRICCHGHFCANDTMLGLKETMDAWASVKVLFLGPLITFFLVLILASLMYWQRKRIRFYRIVPIPKEEVVTDGHEDEEHYLDPSKDYRLRFCQQEYGLNFTPTASVLELIDEKLFDDNEIARNTLIAEMNSITKRAKFNQVIVNAAAEVDGNRVLKRRQKTKKKYAPLLYHHLETRFDTSTIDISLCRSSSIPTQLTSVSSVTTSRSHSNLISFESSVSDQFSTLGSFAGFPMKTLADDLELISSRSSSTMTSKTATASTSAVPSTVLTQRTIALQVMIVRQIGAGRYGNVFQGRWKGEDVAVKVFIGDNDLAWRREVDIYEKSNLRHPNILRFIGSDFHDSGDARLWLITEYHPHGSLYDFLSINPVDMRTALSMIRSSVNGLAFLHTEILGYSVASWKPAIAHRDIKTKNVMVKPDLSCAIGDLGLSVTFDPNTGTMDVPDMPLCCGTVRYLAPEILSKTAQISMFESFRFADIYAFSLLIYEVLQRTFSEHVKPKPIDEALAFHGIIERDPSVEQMCAIVYRRKLRPIFNPEWNNDPDFMYVYQIICECWESNPTARLSALQIRLRLERANVRTPPPKKLRTPKELIRAATNNEIPDGGFASFIELYQKAAYERRLKGQLVEFASLMSVPLTEIDQKRALFKSRTKYAMEHNLPIPEWKEVEPLVEPIYERDEDGLRLAVGMDEVDVSERAGPLSKFWGTGLKIEDVDDYQQFREEAKGYDIADYERFSSELSKAYSFKNKLRSQMSQTQDEDKEKQEENVSAEEEAACPSKSEADDLTEIDEDELYESEEDFLAEPLGDDYQVDADFKNWKNIAHNKEGSGKIDYDEYLEALFENERMDGDDVDRAGKGRVSEGSDQFLNIYTESRPHARLRKVVALLAKGNDEDDKKELRKTVDDIFSVIEVETTADEEDEGDDQSEEEEEEEEAEDREVGGSSASDTDLMKNADDEELLRYLIDFTGDGEVDEEDGAEEESFDEEHAEYEDKEEAECEACNQYCDGDTEESETVEDTEDNSEESEQDDRASMQNMELFETFGSDDTDDFDDDVDADDDDDDSLNTGHYRGFFAHNFLQQVKKEVPRVPQIVCQKEETPSDSDDCGVFIYQDQSMRPKEPAFGEDALDHFYRPIRPQTQSTPAKKRRKSKIPSPKKYLQKKIRGIFKSSSKK